MPPAPSSPPIALSITEGLGALLPPKIAKLIEDHLFEHPELFDKDEQELFRHLRKDEETPNTTDHRLRLKFWMEYDRTMGLGRNEIDLNNVYAGVCSRALFHDHYLKRPNRVAWMLCPPASYKFKTEEGLEFALEQLREILELCHTTGKGQHDHKLMALKVKIFELLDLRVKGAVMQKSVNMNFTKEVRETAQSLTIDELEKQLKELEWRANKAKNLPQAPLDHDPSAPKDVISEPGSS